MSFISTDSFAMITVNFSNFQTAKLPVHDFRLGHGHGNVLSTSTGVEGPWSGGTSNFVLKQAMKRGPHNLDENIDVTSNKLPPTHFLELHISLWCLLSVFMEPFCHHIRKHERKPTG